MPSQEKKKIIIIGAGLTGLTLNYLIQSDINLAKIYDIKIIEGRDRIGGRIFTKKIGAEENTIEMGATWFGSKHLRFLKLINDLSILYFEQLIGNKAHYEPLSTSPPYLVELPPNPEPSLRIQGGTSILIKKLVQFSEPKSILLNEVVSDIEIKDRDIKVITNLNGYSADYVISTLPPYLLNKSVNVHPQLPKHVTDILNATHTWMGESIKIALTYNKAFWKNENLSGTIFSNVGPIPEMYDHSNFENSFYALKGFFNGNFFSISKENRLNKTLSQLRKYYGNEVDNYTSYEECVWRNEPLTFKPYDSHILPHQNNGHSLFQNAYFDDRLFIGGTETAEKFPGYMEGAVRSAEYIFEALKSKLR